MRGRMSGGGAGPDDLGEPPGEGNVSRGTVVQYWEETKRLSAKLDILRWVAGGRARAHIHSYTHTCCSVHIRCMRERERFYSLYQTRRVSRAEPNKNLTKK